MFLTFYVEVQGLFPIVSKFWENLQKRFSYQKAWDNFQAEFYQLQGLVKLIKYHNSIICLSGRAKIPESFSSDDKYLSTFNQVVIIEQNTNHNHATIRGSNLDFLNPTFLELANRTHTTDVTYSDTFSRIQISLRVFDKMVCSFYF